MKVASSHFVAENKKWENIRTLLSCLEAALVAEEITLNLRELASRTHGCHSKKFAMNAMKLSLSSTTNSYFALHMLFY